jgi:hypothetical protein
MDKVTIYAAHGGYHWEYTCKEDMGRKCNNVYEISTIKSLKEPMKLASPSEVRTGCFSSKTGIMTLKWIWDMDVSVLHYGDCGLATSRSLFKEF